MTALSVTPVDSLRSDRLPEIRILPALREWETRTFEGVGLSRLDRELICTLMGDASGRFELEELRTGLRIRARSWVGVVRLETIEIRIIPKLAGDDLGFVRLLEFVSGWEDMSRPEAEATVETTGESLLDLVALLFADATQKVLRRGLMADYQQREEDIPTVRGRILADRQILERFGRIDRIVCRFDELEHDTDENRLLLLALRIASRRVRTPSIRRKLTRLRGSLEPLCDPQPLDLNSFRREIVYHRLNSHYEHAHSLAWLILDALGIDDLFSEGSARTFAFLLDMNILFERFVIKLFEKVLNGHLYSVESQVGHPSLIWNVSERRSYARAIPDVLVRKHTLGKPCVAIDAKYKLYDERKIDSSDVYQAFFYAHSIAKPLKASGWDSRGPVNEALPTTILIYPQTFPGKKETVLEVRGSSGAGAARVVAFGVSIPEAIEEVVAGGTGPVLQDIREFFENELTVI